MVIYDNGKLHTVTLRIWNDAIDDWDCAGADCSDDIMEAPSVMRWEPSLAAYVLIDGETFAGWIEWWSEQVELYNMRDADSWFVDGIFGEDLEAEWERNREYILTYD